MREVDVTMEWGAGLGQQQTLYFEVQLTEDPWNRTYVEGPSPLHAILTIVPGTPLLEDLMVVFGTAGNETVLGSVALLDQPVNVTVRETFACF